MTGIGNCLTFARWMGLILLIAIPNRALIAQGHLNGAFDEAIQFAQKRMVKVYGATAGRVEGFASGVIVSDDGLILTIQGVFLDGTNTRVTLPNGTQVPATVLRRNREMQLALLKVDLATPDFFDLSSEPVGDKGDWVVTLSNAFKVADGVEPMSVNLGIISLRSSIEAEPGKRDSAYQGPLVLIDAITSNPGAGGGAVVTDRGQLVGAIGRVINSSETNTRLNYAVPVELLKRFVDDTLESAAPELLADRMPGDLGIEVFRFGGPLSPAYIDRVVKGSSADLVELRPDDLIVSLGGTKIGTIREYDEVRKKVFIGEEVIIVVKRGNSLIRVPLLPAAKVDQ